MKRFFRLILAAAAAAAFTLPPIAFADEWAIDPSHTMVAFKVRYMMMSWVRGRFAKVKGNVRYEPAKLDAARAEVDIETASIDTQHERRDTHLRSADFLDVEKHPSLAFRSKRVRNVRENGFDLVGDLTIRGVTKEIVLKVEDMSKEAKDQRGRTRVAASAALRLNRHDFGVRWNRALDAGGFLVGDDVEITLDVQLIKKDDAWRAARNRRTRPAGASPAAGSR